MYTTIAKYAILGVIGCIIGWTINGWRLNASIASLKASHAEEIAEAYQSARNAEKRLIEASKQIRKDKDEEIKAIDARLATALGELRQRKERDSLPNTSRDCQGATGAELSREDAEFLTRLAASADKAVAALKSCYKQYDSVRDQAISQ